MEDNYNNGFTEDKDVFNESCTLLLSLPYKTPRRNNRRRRFGIDERRKEIIDLCKNSKVRSEVNKERAAAGKPEIKKLNINFNKKINKTIFRKSLHLQKF